LGHVRDFEHRIRRYPRRLNMKPGITGWAQVNGLRGLTDTDDKMKHRVEADLYYIDNWSILFDIYILVLTVLSPKTFNNAG
jgi:polysaccharide biosynthesis protein PslA